MILHILLLIIEISGPSDIEKIFIDYIISVIDDVQYCVFHMYLNLHLFLIGFITRINSLIICTSSTKKYLTISIINFPLVIGSNNDT
jgi:hypothetical protein